MKTRSHLRYSVKELGLAPEDIEEFIGYERGLSPEPIRGIIENSLEKAGEICAIQGTLLLASGISFNGTASTLAVGGITFEVGKIIFGQIRRSESVALFICTAGARITEAAEDLARRGDDLEAYILDAVGSEVVESAMDRIQDELELELNAEGIGMTDRYSPGYCGWSVAEQHKLFPLFADIDTGVTLTPSALMQPIKSVSGIIGIGKGLRPSGYACSACEMSNCIYRRKKSAVPYK